MRLRAFLRRENVVLRVGSWQRISAIKPLGASIFCAFEGDAVGFRKGNSCEAFAICSASHT